MDRLETTGKAGMGMGIPIFSAMDHCVVCYSSAHVPRYVYMLASSKPAYSICTQGLLDFELFPTSWTQSGQCLSARDSSEQARHKHAIDFTA